MIVSLIVALSKNGIIGKNNKLPWVVKEDLDFFKNITKGKFLIFGRKTFESTGALRDRNIIVLSHTDKLKKKYLSYKTVHFSSNLDNALFYAQNEGCDEVFIAGGAKVYSDALKRNICDYLYVTKLNFVAAGDVHFPVDLDELDANYELVESKKFSKGEFLTYKKKFNTIIEKVKQENIIE